MCSAGAQPSSAQNSDPGSSPKGLGVGAWRALLRAAWTVGYQVLVLDFLPMEIYLAVPVLLTSQCGGQWGEDKRRALGSSNHLRCRDP